MGGRRTRFKSKIEEMEARPSRTALATAAARAAHLVVDRPPWIFEDTLAARLAGDSAEGLIAAHSDPQAPSALASMRVAVVTRSRYTEDRLAEAIERGVSQLVILGAGLDSFAYRSPLAKQVDTFEVDHPATQAWKLEQLKAASIPAGRGVRHVAVDFRVDSMADRLADSGFDRSQPAFVTWLGVTQYLPPDAIGSTLEVVARLVAGTEIVMEYLVPARLRDEPGQALADYFMPLAAGHGEPWTTFLSPAEVSGLLNQRGFDVVDDAGRREQVLSHLWQRTDMLVPHELGRTVRAIKAR